MNRSPVFRTLLLCLILLVGLTTAHAQGENLLANPGFENPFVPVEGGGSSMIAEGWSPWALEFDQYVMPEFYLASDTVNGMAPPRIHSGEDAQQYFTFFAPHIAGVYQQVSGVSAGDQLSFSIFAYVWSSSGDNSDVSDGTGDIVVQVGIDPNGGVDPASDSIVWSDAAVSYDRFEQYTVSAVAAGESVTAFVRSTVNQVAMNNVVYLDDASLVVTGTGVVVEATEAVTGEAPTEAVATDEVTEVATEVVTDVPVEATEVVEVPTEVATEVVAEAPTEVSSEVMTTIEPLLPTEEAVVEATVEVTEAATEEVTEVPTVELPTEVPTEVPPTEIPTEVIPTDVPTEAPPTEIPTDAPPTVTPFPTSTLDTAVFPYMVPYTVVQGDTVGALATRYGSTVEAIIIANGLGSDARIFVTQQLQIPVPVLPTATLIPSATPIPSETPLPTFTPFPTFTLSPTPAPLSTEVPVQIVPVEPGVPDLPIVIAQTYTVQYGDSLSGIAKKFGVDTRELARINNIVNPNLIHVGQVLQIPVSGAPTAVPSATPAPSATTIPPTPTLINPLIYQVQPGDNLYRISIKFNVPLETLIEINGIANASRIFVGQLLVIPQ